MKNHISYPKIVQFRNVIANINREITFTGLDDEGNPTYDPSIPKPTLRFKGTVKLHGTNAGVCYNKQEGLWCQSRANIITPEKDNAGFAFFVESRKPIFLGLIDKAYIKLGLDPSVYTISIYGEWAGKGIQKNVGISELEKAFYVFGLKVSKLDDEDFVAYWEDSSWISYPDRKIYNVEDFNVYFVNVDFNMPQLSQNKFGELTDEVERECPVAKSFGINEGLGEGIVWVVDYKDSTHQFKVKGTKHSVSKVKVLASVDVEKLKTIQDFIEYAVTENRFTQAVENVFGAGDLDITKIGDLIRWFIKDIASEELDTMSKNGLEPNDVNRYISVKVKEMFFREQDKY